jgi:hypothetical protein
MSPSPTVSPDQSLSLPPPSPPNAAPTDDEALQEEVESYMLVDWARAQERAKRFEEEVELSVEEMRRTLLFFSWKAAEWKRLAQSDGYSSKGLSDEVIEGLRAYAFRRSAMFQELIKVFISDWAACLKPKGLGAELLAQYSDVIVVRKGWNRIPLIIPPTFAQPDAEPDDAVLSDLDEALERADEDTCMDQDAESELRTDFVQIFVGDE